MKRPTERPAPRSSHKASVYLIIDASDGQSIKIGLANRRSIIDFQELKLIKPSGAQCLRGIDRLVKQSRINRNALKGLLVVQGTGPFTAVRTGVVLVNALVASLDIPGAGAKSDVWSNFSKYLLKLNNKQSIKPKYGRPPNITYPKVSLRKS